MGLSIPSQFITLWNTWNCSTRERFFVLVALSFSQTMNGISNCCLGAKSLGRPCMNMSTEQTFKIPEPEDNNLGKLPLGNNNLTQQSTHSCLLYSRLQATLLVQKQMIVTTHTSMSGTMQSLSASKRLHHRLYSFDLLTLDSLEHGTHAVKLDCHIGEVVEHGYRSHLVGT